MKASEITADTVAEYLRLDDSSDTIIGPILEAAKQYVVGYTGQTLEDLDNYPDITIAILTLCQDMYDNRAYQADVSSDANRVTDSILGMYSINLL